MANTLYTTKTLTNQALIARPWGNRITLPVLLPVLLVTLFVLSACGGSKAAPPAVTPNPPANPCAANPFSDICINDVTYESARDTIIKGCIVGNNADSTECENAVARYPCIETPFIPECSAPDSTFAPYVETAQVERRDFCEIEANAANDLCVTSVANICESDIFDDLCPASTLEEKRNFCRRGDNLRNNRNCAAIAAPVCALNPLFDALCAPDIARQRAHCEMGSNIADDRRCDAVVMDICTDNLFDTICTADDTALANFCLKDNNLLARADNCTPFADRICATSPFDAVCANHGALKVQACAGSIAGLRNLGGATSDCIIYADNICGYGRVGGLNPHAEICEDAAFSDYSATIATVRVAFCQANIFHASCDIGYITERVAACHLNGVPTDADPRCSAIIADNCPSSGTRNAACHTVVTLTEASNTTDPITNYVEATASELELGFTQSAPPTNISDFSKGTIQLS
ncbi:MAG: hypothetical protein K8953_01200, partial [Proteobacteria bacterium]|nr:hypothetical protein [Pseudomonadota bacterium]